MMANIREFLRPVVKHPLALRLRNFVGIRPYRPAAGNLLGWVLPGGDESFSSSDLFVWRTDGDFRTVIRVSDIARNYFGLDSSLLLRLYDSEGGLIREAMFEFRDNVMEIAIDEDLLEGRKGIGTFAAFHLIDEDVADVKIINRCYVGYSNGGNLPSFVHGNIIGEYVKLGKAKRNVRNDTLFPLPEPTHYTIQKDFSLYDRSELFFVNATQYRVWIEVNGERKTVEPPAPVRFNVESSDLVELRSNCPCPRPTVFSYKGEFYDCHHA
jgi:hypothetical protein